MSKVIVVGDMMVDIWNEGRWTKINPEDDVPVFNIEKYTVCPGGASNVSYCLRTLGHEVVEYFGGKSSWKTRYIKDGHQLFRMDDNAQGKEVILTKDDFQGVDAVVVSDYAKGAVGAATIASIAKFDGPVFIDTKKSPAAFNHVKNTTFFPNHKELHMHFDSYQDVQRVEKYGKDGLVYYDGLIWADWEKPVTKVPGIVVPVKSVAGAGDVVLAAYVTACFETYTPFGRIDFANRMAAMAVMRPYTCHVEKGDFSEAR